MAAATQGQALAALLFLYKQVLGRDLGWLDGMARAKRPVRLPTVLSVQEVEALLAELRGGARLMASLLYGAELRASSSAFPATPCVIPSLRTSCTTATTSARCRSCSGTATFPPP